jgi:hypothetical protein
MGVDSLRWLRLMNNHEIYLKYDLKVSFDI